jgi:hypothetical protein
MRRVSSATRSFTSTAGAAADVADADVEWDNSRLSVGGMAGKRAESEGGTLWKLVSTIRVAVTAGALDEGTSGLFSGRLGSG